MPTEAAAHGAPVRQYINSKITGVLLEGMKIVAREQYVLPSCRKCFFSRLRPRPRGSGLAGCWGTREGGRRRTKLDELAGLLTIFDKRPKDPLRVLGEFLLQRSRETEGKESGS